MNPPADDLLLRCASNCGGAYAALASAMGRPARRWDDVWVSDLGLPVPLSPNNATVLRPLTRMELDGALERVESFFAPSPGGGYEVWNLWPAGGAVPAGFETYPSPCMLLAPDAEPRPVPPELRVVEASDANGIRDAEALWIEGFEIEGAEAGSICDERALGGWRIWVGYVDDVPVSTAAAYASDGLVGVYGVATTAGARGRGYGEALSWTAVGAQTGRPATLQASSMGRPVYERMGFEPISEFTVWVSPGR